MHIDATVQEYFNNNSMLPIVRADWINSMVDDQVKSCHSVQISVGFGLHPFTNVLPTSRATS